MTSTLARRGSEIVLQLEGSDAIHLSPERATLIAGAVLMSTSVNERRVMVEIARSNDVRLVVIADPVNKEIAVGNVSRWGIQFAGWRFAEATEAAETLLRLAKEIRTAPVKARRKAA